MNESKSNWYFEHSSGKKKTRYAKRNKRIPTKTSDNVYGEDWRGIESSKDTGGTLFQNRWISGNTKSRGLASVKRVIGFWGRIRQASDGIVQEGNGLRDVKKGVWG